MRVNLTDNIFNEGDRVVLQATDRTSALARARYDGVIGTVGINVGAYYVKDYRTVTDAKLTTHQWWVHMTTRDGQATRMMFTRRACGVVFTSGGFKLELAEGG
jgi:hypothetical protein